VTDSCQTKRPRNIKSPSLPAKVSFVFSCDAPSSLTVSRRRCMQPIWFHGRDFIPVRIIFNGNFGCSGGL
jgi:hypothetical protein